MIVGVESSDAVSEISCTTNPAVAVHVQKQPDIQTNNIGHRE